MKQWIEYKGKFVCLDNISHFEVYEHQVNMEDSNMIRESMGVPLLKEQLPPVFQVEAYIATSYFTSTLGGEYDNWKPSILIAECETEDEAMTLIRSIIKGDYSIDQDTVLYTKKDINEAIGVLEKTSNDINKYWDRLPGQLTGNPESCIQNAIEILEGKNK